MHDRHKLEEMYQDADAGFSDEEEYYSSSEYVSEDPDDELMNEDLNFDPCFGKAKMDFW